MSARYVVVTELEFDNVCKPDKGWVKTYQGEELVYQYTTKKNPDVVVKVFSSITKSGLGRKCGGDAVRVCAVNTKTNRGIIKSSRVYRVPGWEDRVKARVLETIEKVW
jgi:hypothetical protein